MNNLPSKAEVMGWNVQSLADYMRKLKLTGCDKVVMKASISGQQFVNMTESELEVFPCLYVPIITKIQSEINKEEQKKAFGHKFKALKSPKQAFSMREESWDSDEFENESENEYEGPDQEDYICTMSEPAEEQHSDETCDAADLKKPPRPPRPTKRQDSHRGERTMKLPPLPRKNPNSQKTLKSATAGQHSLHTNKTKMPSQKDTPKLRGRAIEDPGSSSFKHPQPLPPRPTDLPNRPHKATPPLPVPTQPVKSLDPSWYGGKVTRHQAEVAVRLVNKDGAFMVRDSLKGWLEHPYTLVLLYQGKVYNIKIRNQGNSYSLGSGLKNTQSFPGVKEMITHHTHTPLLLIDATDESPEEQPQSKCCLLHPVAL